MTVGTGQFALAIFACLFSLAVLLFLAPVSKWLESRFGIRIAPAAMLFIPCRNGYSHRPDEYASPEDIARGALVLAEALATLSR